MLLQLEEGRETQTKVSSDAGRVLRLIREHEQAEYTIEELARELRLSRTATGRAMAELENAGAITIEEES